LSYSIRAGEGEPLDKPELNRNGKTRFKRRIAFLFVLWYYMYKFAASLLRPSEMETDMSRADATILGAMVTIVALIIGGVTMLYVTKSMAGRILWMVVLTITFWLPAMFLATNLFGGFTEFQMYVLFPLVMDSIVILGRNVIVLLVRRLKGRPSAKSTI
jgi:hypothetical protein